MKTGSIAARSAHGFAPGRFAALVLLLGVCAAACGTSRAVDDKKGRGRRKDPSAASTAEGRGRQKPPRKKRADRQAEPPPATPQPSAPPSPAQPPPASAHLALGAPTDADPSDDHLMIKPEYALSYNRSKNIANWVSWNLNASHFGDAPRMQGKFLSDESLPAGFYHVRHEDYVGTGFDRGHMVRSEERTRSPEDNRSTFLLTNILPQRHDLNAGPWLRLEEYCQRLAQKEGRELYLMAGGVFTAGKAPETIGKGVAVPDAFFKIVVVVDRGQGAPAVNESTRVIAVIMPNTTGIMDSGWATYRTTVDDVERRTGYEFLSAVPEAVQRVVEARADGGPVD